MLYILIDESGDLGAFGKKGVSRHFIVTAVCTRNKRRLEKIATRNRALGHGKRSSGILHANNETDSTRRHVGRDFAKTDDSVFVSILDKSQYRIINDQSSIYRKLLIRLLGQIAQYAPGQEMTICIVSRWETKGWANEFLLRSLAIYVKAAFGKASVVRIVTQQEEKALQIADYASWAFYRKLEYGDSRYYDQIANRMFVQVFLENNEKRFWRFSRDAPPL